jgi:hypothetical protein
MSGRPERRLPRGDGPDHASDPFNAISFLVNQVINKKWTITLGLVKKVTGASPADNVTVDVQPMVNQSDGYGNATPHGTIYTLPVLRQQGGAGAVLIDPKVGDIGIVAFASRDISSVVANKAPANPGSRRTFDPADGIYVGSILGAAPTRYIQITDDKVSIVFSETVKIELSASGVVITVGASVVNIADGVVTINGIEWATHTHAVTTAPGETGPPV